MISLACPKCKHESQYSEAVLRLLLVTEAFKIHFWQRVQIRKPDECWEWQKARLQPVNGMAGYGVVWVPSKQDAMLAHCVAWELSNDRPIPPGLKVRHTCDNRPCCNPAHLILGTTKDNANDMVLRGRQNPVCLAALLAWTRKHRGRPANAKLTLRKARRIRTLYARGASQDRLAEQFGVTQSNISLIVNGRKWK